VFLFALTLTTPAKGRSLASLRRDHPVFVFFAFFAFFVLAVGPPSQRPASGCFGETGYVSMDQRTRRDFWSLTALLSVQDDGIVV
jgi:hypothetical protein